MRFVEEGGDIFVSATEGLFDVCGREMGAVGSPEMNGSDEETGPWSACVGLVGDVFEHLFRTKKLKRSLNLPHALEFDEPGMVGGKSG